MLQDIIIRIAADGLVIPGILLGLFALIFKVPKGRRFEVYSRVLMAGLTAYFLAKLIGAVYQPVGERPFELLGASAGALYLNNPGFPSDHTLFLTAITCAVWFETRQRAITIILICLIILVSIGRVVALVHTPLDIVGGIVIGLIGAVWYMTGRRQEKTSTVS